MRLLVTLTLLAILGCEAPDVPEAGAPESAETTWPDGHAFEELFAKGEARYVAPTSTFEELIGSNPSFTFLSRQGEFAGMDSDTVITFRDDRTFTLIEVGLGSTEYTGKVTVEDDGAIILDFENSPRSWPTMRFERLGDSCFLHRVDGKTGFIFGGRSGAVTSGDMKPFWPFALLDHELILQGESEPEKANKPKQGATLQRP